MYARQKYWAEILLVLAMVCRLWGQGINDPTGDADAGNGPPWLDYTMLFYEQQGESLYVAITFDGPIASKGEFHSGNTFFNDYDDNIETGQQGTRVGSETNLTFTEWDGDGLWCMRVFGLWDQDIGTFVFRALTPIQISEDGTTMSFKHSLVGLGLEDVTFDVNGYYLEGSVWTDPYHFGDQIEDIGLASFDPSLVTSLVVKEGAFSTLEVPEPYSARADAENVTTALDDIVSIIQTNIGSITPEKKYTVTYNPFSDYPVFVYISSPNNTFTTYIPGGDWVEEPNWWAMLEGAVYLTMSELNAGYREVFQTTMATDIPLPGTTDNWYSTHDDSTHGLLYFLNHRVTFKALLGRAYHNLITIYLGEMLTHGDANAAAQAARLQAADAYAAFSGNAEDLDPWIMTGFLLNNLGSDLTWTMQMWDALPEEFELPDAEQGIEGDSFGKLAQAFLRDGMEWQHEFSETRKAWYQNIASVQAAAIDEVTGQDIYTELKAIDGYPTVDSVYTQARAVFNELITSVEESSPIVVGEFELTQNYPNPFNPTTQFSFMVPTRNHVTIKVFDVIGREVATAFNGTVTMGRHEVLWNAGNLPSGIYFYQIRAGRFSATRKAILLK